MKNFDRRSEKLNLAAFVPRLFPYGQFFELPAIFTLKREYYGAEIEAAPTDGNAPQEAKFNIIRLKWKMFAVFYYSTANNCTETVIVEL